MDGARFDVLTRSLASVPSRRRFLAGLGAAALSLIGAHRGEAASCREPGAICREHANCCSNFCGTKDSWGRRRCACKTPTVVCNDECVDPTIAFQSDVANCGSCGNQCQSDQC